MAQPLNHPSKGGLRAACLRGPLWRHLGMGSPTGRSAFAPVSKLVPAWIAGRRTLKDGRMLVKCLKNRLDDHIPFFTSDDLPHYANALLDAYGQKIEPPLEGRAARFRDWWLPPRWPLEGPLTGNPPSNGGPTRSTSQQLRDPARKWPSESGPGPSKGHLSRPRGPF